jgi:RNase P subunit RPR2|tara:strand:- start:982 stop:1263 length:282 start_codon:yes stop_codon:yes gene_type:complete
MNQDTKDVDNPKYKSKKSPKPKICKKCGLNLNSKHTKKYKLNKNNKKHIVWTKEYCDDHEIKYPNHKVKPIWCDECGYFVKYLANIIDKKQIK